MKKPRIQNLGESPRRGGRGNGRATENVSESHRANGATERRGHGASPKTPGRCGGSEAIFPFFSLPNAGNFGMPELGPARPESRRIASRISFLPFFPPAFCSLSPRAPLPFSPFVHFPSATPPPPYLTVGGRPSIAGRFASADRKGWDLQRRTRLKPPLPPPHPPSSPPPPSPPSAWLTNTCPKRRSPFPAPPRLPPRSVLVNRYGRLLIGQASGKRKENTDGVPSTLHHLPAPEDRRYLLTHSARMYSTVRSP